MDTTHGGNPVQREMANLLQSIGASATYDDDDDGDDGMEDSPDYRAGGAEESFATHGGPSTTTRHPDMSIFGAEGQLLYQDIVDGDLVEHDDALQSTFIAMKSAARLHLIQIKQRLIAEKESALNACERHHVRLMEAKEEELAEVQVKHAETEKARSRMVVRYEAIKSKVPFLLDRSRAYYSTQCRCV